MEIRGRRKEAFVFVVQGDHEKKKGLLKKREADLLFTRWVRPEERRLNYLIAVL